MAPLRFIIAFCSVALLLVSYINCSCNQGDCQALCNSQYGTEFLGNAPSPRMVRAECNDPEAGTSDGNDYCACYDDVKGYRINWIVLTCALLKANNRDSLLREKLCYYLRALAEFFQKFASHKKVSTSRCTQFRWAKVAALAPFSGRGGGRKVSWRSHHKPNNSFLLVGSTLPWVERCSHFTKWNAINTIPHSRV